MGLYIINCYSLIYPFYQIQVAQPLTVPLHTLHIDTRKEQFNMKRSTMLDRYQPFVGEDLLAQIYQAAEPLRGLRILHVNTTAQGGGVAELLHALIPVMDELGILNTWQVIPLDDAYNVCVFNTPLSIFKDLPQEKTHVITPTIDPFSEKNRLITPAKGLQMLARCGIDTRRPLITQVSRFGNWKNPWQVLDVYRLVKQELPSVQVALVGAMEAADDIKAMEILKDIQGMAGDDPDIHLLYDAAEITHAEVNAFQRYSSVILQRSTREGFGLTVTEAMWKNQPVVGTSVTGLRTQIIDGQNSYLADDTQTCAKYTLKLIQDRELWQKLGKRAHERVKDNYLLPMMILQYLGALAKAQGESEEPLLVRGA